MKWRGSIALPRVPEIVLLSLSNQTWKETNAVIIFSVFKLINWGGDGKTVEEKASNIGTECIFKKSSTVIQSRDQGYIPKGEEHVHQADPDTEPLIKSPSNEQGLDYLAKTENIPAGLSPSVVILLCYRKEYRTHGYSHQHTARKGK